MQFLLIAHDYKDGLPRRMAARDEHVKMGDKMKEAGNFLFGVALLNEKEEMVGSVMILEYPSRKELDKWLKVEPYVVQKVWEKIEIIPCKIGPTFEVHE